MTKNFIRNLVRLTDKETNVYLSDAKTLNLVRSTEIEEEIKDYFTNKFPQMIENTEDPNLKKYVLGCLEDELKKLLSDELMKDAQRYYDHAFG